MDKNRRTFTPEFKREAASLVLDQGFSHIEAARSLGWVESVLHLSPDVKRLLLRSRVNELFTQSRSAAGTPTRSPW